MMKHWLKGWFVGLLLIFITTLIVDAQTPPPPPVNQENIKERKLNRQTWKKAEDGLDYTDHRPKPKEKQTETKTENKLSSTQQLVLIIVFIIVFALIIFLLLRSLGINVFQLKKEKREKLFSEQNLIDDIPESELERLIREAINKKDFREAIRLYYLIVIKELSERKWISWRREKTNHDYLREMKVEEYRVAFREATNIFETVWYGERSIDAASFEQVNPRFLNLISRIKSPR